MPCDEVFTADAEIVKWLKSFFRIKDVGHTEREYYWRGWKVQKRQVEELDSFLSLTFMSLD